MTAYVEVRGTGSSEAEPDLVLLHLVVRSRAEAIDDVVADMSRSTRAVLTGIEAAGVAATDVQTSSLEINPSWDDLGRRLRGYRAVQRLRVTLRDVALVGEIVTAGVHAAAERFGVHHLQWTFADTTAVRAEALERAWADARAKAESVAQLSGRALGPVLRVREAGHGYDEHTPMSAAYGQDDDEVPTAAGQQSVTATVVVRWQLV